jgi:hypothetical protein
VVFVVTGLLEQLAKLQRAGFHGEFPKDAAAGAFGLAQTR